MEDTINKPEITLDDLAIMMAKGFEEVKTDLRAEIRDVETGLRTEIRNVEINLKAEIQDLSFKDQLKN